MMVTRSGCPESGRSAETTMKRFFRAAITLGLLLAALTAGGLSRTGAEEKAEWAAGVPYHTDYEAAIKQANETGRILLIYNGWQGDGR
jgi:hypothetical protein